MLVTLTHVCRGWRRMLISCSSLWTRFTFENVDKTRTYIQRSHSSPLAIDFDDEPLIDAFALIIPHFHRLRSLTAKWFIPSNVVENLYRPAPLLEKLDIGCLKPSDPDLSRLFNGEFSLLRELKMGGATKAFPGKLLANLKVVNIDSRREGYRMTQLLDFFESAPLLTTVSLRSQISDPSDVPSERIVPLSYLKDFTLAGTKFSSTLLHHLRIPAGASLTLDSSFRGEGSPLQDHLQKIPTNFGNLSHITAINLFFDSKHAFIAGIFACALLGGRPSATWWNVDFSILLPQSFRQSPNCPFRSGILLTKLGFWTGPCSKPFRP